eukprot:1141309-Pelagomonas_calceolata.AAC.5
MSARPVPGPDEHTVHVQDKHALLVPGPVCAGWACLLRCVLCTVQGRAASWTACPYRLSCNCSTPAAYSCSTRRAVGAARVWSLDHTSFMNA